MMTKRSLFILPMLAMGLLLLGAWNTPSTATQSEVDELGTNKAFICGTVRTKAQKKETEVRAPDGYEAREVFCKQAGHQGYPSLKKCRSRSGCREKSSCTRGFKPICNDYGICCR